MSAPFQSSSTPRDPPYRTVIKQNQEKGVEPWARGELPWAWIGGLALVAGVACLVAWRLRRRGASQASAGERAFRRIAAKLGLGRAAREVLRELAAECDAEPLVIVVSPTALRDVVARVDHDAWRRRKGWKRVLALSEAG